MSVTEAVFDKVLEATVVGSFSKIGYDVRSRLGHWDEPPSMKGRSVLVTGATSGLGQEAATRLASLGASVRFVARDESRACIARRTIVDASGSDDVGYVIADMSDFDSVRAVAARLSDEFDVLDVLVHNAGALTPVRAVAADGTELTVASQLLGPFLLTSLLLPPLSRSGPGRVVTVSSGGMYSQRFDLDRLEMGNADYNGVTAYARAKRAQLVLNHEWARRVDSALVVFQAMHPGWADTPGVRSSLPGFYRLMRPLLRSSRQGADTIVWLAAAPEATHTSGDFWLDRHRRWEHKLPWTRPRDAATDEARLWDWCVTRTGSQEPHARTP
jgi:dehydrogenase/reductase SDR family protein 12